MFVHSIGFGILVIIVGLIAGFFLKGLVPVLPSTCKKWNINNVMEINLFLAGMISFLIYNKFIKT